MIKALTLLDDDEELFRNSILDFADQEIAPLVSRMDETSVLDPDLIKKCFKIGLMSIEIPENYGGPGGSFFQAILAIQSLAQVDPSVSVFVDVQNTLFINAILRWANESVKQYVFSKVLQDAVGSYCLTEPSSGSDAFALKTVAVEDKEHYEITGKKIFITNAKESTFFLVFANVDLKKGYKGITAFLVEKGMPGFVVGKKEDKLGIRASSTCELIFDKVRVPKDWVVGEIGVGYKIAIETLNEGRIGIASQMLGLSIGACESAVKYVKDREQFGHSIASFQSVQFSIARMASQIEAGKLLVYNAARLKEAKLPFAKEAAMAKLFCSEMAQFVSSLSLDLFGGYGFVKDYPVEKFYRDSKIGSIYEGTTNMQLQTISKMLLN